MHYINSSFSFTDVYTLPQAPPLEKGMHYQPLDINFNIYMSILKAKGEYSI
jgi:hypothetical protein